MSSVDSVGVGIYCYWRFTENIASLESFYTSISSSGSPGIHTIATYTNTADETDYSAAYYIVSIEDTTNNQYQMSEVIVLNDTSESYITEYG